MEQLAPYITYEALPLSWLSSLLSLSASCVWWIECWSVGDRSAPGVFTSGADAAHGRRQPVLSLSSLICLTLFFFGFADVSEMISRAGEAAVF